MLIRVKKNISIADNNPAIPHWNLLANNEYTLDDELAKRIIDIGYGEIVVETIEEPIKKEKKVKKKSKKPFFPKVPTQLISKLGKK